MLHNHARSHLPAFLVQVLATAVGLMLALDLDQWRDHRRQAELARAHLAAIQAELRADLSELDAESSSLEEQDRMLETVTRFLQVQKPGALDVHLGFSMASLRQSAWDMAVAAQTPLRSELERMGRLANAYESLRLVRSLNEELLKHLSILGELLPLLERHQIPAGPQRQALAARIAELRASMILVLKTLPSTRRDLAAALAP